MIGITSLDKPMAVSYQQFESFANTCVSLPLRVDISQLYYRMMIRSHPDQLFPPSSLAMAITAVELEVSPHPKSNQIKVPMPNALKPKAHSTPKNAHPHPL